MLEQRTRPARDRRWLAAVHRIETCVLCGCYGVQAAHRNEGKGASQKVDDALTAALCPACHYELDNGAHLSRDQRRAEMDRAIVLTLQQLVRRGLVGGALMPMRNSCPHCGHYARIRNSRVHDRRGYYRSGIIECQNDECGWRGTFDFPITGALTLPASERGFHGQS